jgi:heavy metal sensor kinase
MSVGVLSLMLFFFSLVLYHWLDKKLNDDIDSLLQSRAEGIVVSLDLAWESQKSKIPSAESSSPLQEEMTSFTKFIQNWISEKIKEPFFLNTNINIFNPDGKHIVSSKNIPELTAPPEEVVQSVAQGESRFSDDRIKIAPKRFLKLRSLTIPVMENDKISYILQVSTPLTPVEISLNHLKFILLTLLPTGIILSGLVGTILAKIALTPVNNIIGTIHRITSENMKLRITIPDSKDEIRNLADTFNDMLDRLENAFSSQRQLVENLAHELRTPLAILKGEIEVSLKKVRSVPEYKQVLTSSLEEVNSIVKLVEDLLFLAHAETDLSDDEQEPMDVGSTVLEAIEDIRVLADSKSISIQFVAGDQIVIKGDRKKLKRVFLNILDNAAKYTPPQGKVTVRAVKKNGKGEITISDTGMGISPKELPHIFKRFYRTEKNTDTSGFGLGLSIVKAIVESFQGKIEVDSEEGKGSTFKISFPLPPTH